MILPLLAASLVGGAATFFIMRIFFMPISAIEAIESAVAFLEGGSDAMTTKVARPIVDKVNAIQDWGKAKGRAESQAQINALTAQVADLQAQLATADSSGQVAVLQEQLTEVQAALAVAQDTAAAVDRRLIAASQRITDAARSIDNQATGVEAVLDSGAVQENPEEATG